MFIYYFDNYQKNSTYNMLNQNKFIDKILSITSISNQSKIDLSDKLKKLVLPKGHILVKPYSVCNHTYYVEQGLTRTFYYKDGKDVTDWFSLEDTFATSIVSFISGKPDRRGIELLEPSVLYSLSHDDLEDLCNKHHDVERLARLLISSGLVEMQKRFDDLHFATALQRYKTLLEDKPALINRAPLGMIASYLGITQETLSRMRLKI